MYSIYKPNTDFSEFFTLCANRKLTPESDNLLNALPTINAAVIQYDSKASRIGLHELQPIPIKNLYPATPENLKSLYASQMVNKGGQGRCEYERILANSKKNRCCFCSYNDPTELDHFLPKSVFPEFSILPINLVPSCHHCNKLKASDTPTSAAKSYIHPYYEEYDSLIWLEAKLNFDDSGNPTVTYQISNSLKVNRPELATRIEYQFKVLQLNQRYSVQASEEVLDIAFMLERLKNSAGKDQVKNQLSEAAQSRASRNRNSWQSALYLSLCESDRFCDMAWKTKGFNS